jgi:hypothetical protein
MRMIRFLSMFSIGVLLPCIVSAQKQACSPCTNGEAPFSTDDDDDDDDDYCADLVAASQMLRPETPECAASQLANYQSECCSAAPRGMCTLCPDGALYIGSKVVPNINPSDGDISCADLNANQAFLDYIFEAGTCSDTLLQRSAAWCGCPGVPRQCSLCPNGERPPNPRLIDPVYYGWDCDHFDFVSSYFSRDECTGLVADIFEFDAPSFCGCLNSPIPDVCNLCPDGQPLTNVDQPLGSGGKFTCRELALSMKYIPAVEPCARVLETYRDNGFVDTCCGGSASNTPSKPWAIGGSARDTPSKPWAIALIGVAAIFACLCVVGVVKKAATASEEQKKGQYDSPASAAAAAEQALEEQAEQQLQQEQAHQEQAHQHQAQQEQEQLKQLKQLKQQKKERKERKKKKKEKKEKKEKKQKEQEQQEQQNLPTIS